MILSDSSETSKIREHEIHLTDVWRRFVGLDMTSAIKSDYGLSVMSYLTYVLSVLSTSELLSSCLINAF
uniref:Ovule protein n=1 Tax=Steinernema glaseri TaxID=37863 RepID=A0A1I7ZAM7_9BILA